MDTASLSADPALEPSCAGNFIKSIVVVPADELVDRKVVVGGWVKTGREQGKSTFAFLELNDGSCLAKNLQMIVDEAVFPLSQLVPTGTYVLVEGELKKQPEGAEQSVEVMVEKLLELDPVDLAKYPLPKTRLTLEFLRAPPWPHQQHELKMQVCRLSLMTDDIQLELKLLLMLFSRFQRHSQRTLTTIP